MQSAWLGEERQFDAVRPGVFTSMSRRVRVALGAVLSALLVAGGLGFAAAPAQANGSASVGFGGVNQSILLLVTPGDGDASTTTLTRENVTVYGFGQNASAGTDVTLTGGSLTFDQAYLDDTDGTVTPLILNTGLDTYDATYIVSVADATGTGVLQEIVVDNGVNFYSGPPANGAASTFTLTQSAQGARTASLSAVIFKTTLEASDYDFADFVFFTTNSTTGLLTEISDATDSGTLSAAEVVIEDVTYIDISGTITFPSTSFDTVIGAYVFDVEFGGGQLGVFFGATEFTLAGSGGGGGGGDTGGGGSSTPAAPSTDSGTTPAPDPAPAPVQPVVFSDPAVVTPQEIAALSPAQVATITPEQFGDLDPAAFAGFTAAQVQAMNTGQINAIRPARAAQLPLPAVAALDGEQLFVMRPAAVAALKPEALEILTAAQLGSVRPEAFKKMDGERINKIRPVQVEFLNREQIKAINEDGISEMRLDTLREFTRAQVRAFRPDQIAAMSDRQIEVLWGRWSGGLRNVQEQALITEANERGLRLRL